VHTRRGDLVTSKLATSPAETVKAVKEVIQKQMKKNASTSKSNTTALDSSPPLMLLIGEEKRFLRKLARDIGKEIKFENAVSISGELPRAEEMCYAVNVCDSLLITAHLSTFGFWIGALMPEGSPVYYISNAIDAQVSPQSRENYPTEWTPIRV